MKKSSCLAAAVTLLLAACNDDSARPAESGKSQLETENRKLAERVKRLEAGTKKKDEDLARLNVQYLDLATKLDEKQALVDRLLAASKTLIAATETRDALRQERPSLVPISPAMPVSPIRPEPAGDPLAGIPGADATAIKNRALREWPGNGRMQLSEIEGQAEGWRKMNRYDTQAFETIPYREKQDMVAAARREWPDNFRMQASEFEGQSSAWKTLAEWERTGIPGFPFKDRKPIIDEARKQWGTNYRMVVSDVERAAAK